jgi:hypothetical protein
MYCDAIQSESHYRCLGEVCILHLDCTTLLSGVFGQRVTPKRRKVLSTRLLSITSQNTVVAVVRTSDLINYATRTACQTSM